MKDWRLVLMWVAVVGGWFGRGIFEYEGLLWTVSSGALIFGAFCLLFRFGEWERRNRAEEHTEGHPQGWERGKATGVREVWQGLEDLGFADEVIARRWVARRPLAGSGIQEINGELYLLDATYKRIEKRADELRQGLYERAPDDEFLARRWAAGEPIAVSLPLNERYYRIKKRAEELRAAQG